MSAAENATYQIKPPRTSGLHKPQNVATGAAAVATAVFTGLSTDAPSGHVMVTFYALSQDVYIRFRSDNSADTTSTNGYPIPAGSEVTYWLNPNVDVYVDHIAPGGVGALRWYVCSPEFGGSK
jgi:hypothetical protein